MSEIQSWRHKLSNTAWKWKMWKVGCKRKEGDNQLHRCGGVVYYKPGWICEDLEKKRKREIKATPHTTHTHTYLLNVAIQTKEVEDAGAVHLGWVEAAHHGNRAGGVTRVWGGRLGQRVGHHVWDVDGGELVSAVAGQRQQGAGWTWEGGDSNSSLSRQFNPEAQWDQRHQNSNCVCCCDLASGK